MSRNDTLYQLALKHIPAGVNSPVRAFGAVGGTPLFISRGQGAYLWDANDRSYIDYVASWGPLILGHAHPEVEEAVIQAAKQGLSFGAPTEREILLADKICALMPIEKIRMVNSGTEATMSAIRLARGFTGRDKIIKFVGCYHGHADHLLIKAGSGALTFGQPSSAGVPKNTVTDTLLADFNDLASVEKLFLEYPKEIAGIIVEPFAGNMNFIPGTEAFLKGLRALCDQYQAVLIFDEVMTGFRVALGGVQALYQIKPDLTTLGKVIGGGMPVGAFGGRAEIMDCISPTGPVYQAGTLSGNPVAMAAGLKTLELISRPGFYEALSQKTQTLCQGLTAAAKRAGIPFLTQSCGSMFGLFFTDQKAVTHYAAATACHIDQFKQFFHGMLEEGIYLAPSAYEAGFMSSAHSEADIAATIAAAEKVFQRRI